MQIEGIHMRSGVPRCGASAPIIMGSRLVHCAALLIHHHDNTVVVMVDLYCKYYNGPRISGSEVLPEGRHGECNKYVSILNVPVVVTHY